MPPLENETLKAIRKHEGKIYFYLYIFDMYIQVINVDVFRIVRKAIENNIEVSYKIDEVDSMYIKLLK